MALSNAERQARYRERKKQKQSGAAEVPERTAPAPARKSRVGLNEKTPLDAETIDSWLEIIASGATTTQAAEAMGHSRRTLQQWKDKSPENLARYREAFARGNDIVRDELFRRGIHGYEEVTTDAKGEVIRTVHRYSDALAKQVAAARMPEEYRENYQQGGSQPTVIIVESSFRARRAAPIELEATEVAELEEGS